MKVSKIFSFFMLNLVLVSGCFGGDGTEFDVNKQNEIGSTPLHYAVAFGRQRLVKKLLKLGADCSIKNYEGENALHYAACSWRESAGGISRILIKICKKAEISIDEPDNEGMTALHLAAKCGVLPVVWPLVRNGADINARDNKGRTPLHWAAVQGNVREACLLLLLGADMNIKDVEGQTADDLNMHMDIDRVFRLFKKNKITRFRARFCDIPYIFGEIAWENWKEYWEEDDLRRFVERCNF